MVLSRDTVEAVGALRLPLGGINGYIGVRGRQGYRGGFFALTCLDACMIAARPVRKYRPKPVEYG